MTIHTLLMIFWPVSSIIVGASIGRAIAAADMRDRENVKGNGLIHKDDL